MRTVIVPKTQGSAHAFISYLHAVREEERVALARRIHDELGGLLVSAAMDLGWAESHASAVADLRARLRRLGANLASAIDIKRHMIEELRPTLLDNFGLFEAVRWYFKHACQPTKVTCHDEYSPNELYLAPLALSNIFRATQTLLDCTFAEDSLKSVALNASIDHGLLSIRIDHEHVGPESVDVEARFRHELQSAAHRAVACGGELSFDSHETGLSFHLKAPLTEMQGTLP